MTFHEGGGRAAAARTQSVPPLRRKADRQGPGVKDREATA